jgi:hypothetical protein
MYLKPLLRLTITTFFLPCIWGARCLAQDKHVRELSPVSAADFAPNPSSVVDSTGAVILADIGQIRFVGNEYSWLSYEFQRHRRVKVLSKSAFDDLVTVYIQLYHPEEGEQEKLEKVSASTYNLENGQISEVKLDKKDILADRVFGNWIVMKFTLPGVKEGSIVDYTYTVTSPYYRFLPTWEFQSERYPCLWSELMVEIPQTFFYTVIKQGAHPYMVDKGEVGVAGIHLRDGNGGYNVIDATVTKHHWIMKDIPGFPAEEYLYCPGSYVDKIDFQLTKTYSGYQFDDYDNSWKEVTVRLLERSDFASALDDGDKSLSDCIKIAVTGGDMDHQAREIYYYLTHNFTCNDPRDMYITGHLADVVRKQSGSVGDINLLLVALLRKIGLKADPVVLTTRDEGINLSAFPVLRRLNYVIVRVVIDGKVWYVDAAHRKLGFGQLDEECYNGPARIISRTDSGSVDLEADSVQERKSTVVYISAIDKDAGGTWESTLGPQESYELRKSVNEESKTKYFKNIQTQYGEDLTISDAGIDSLDQPDDPVKIHYSFNIHKTGDEAKIYLNPFIGAGLRNNPFMAAERKYPIEMPYVSDELYVFNMQIPDGYAVEELPKSVRGTLNARDGTFDYLIGEQGGMVQLRCRLKLNKATFSPEDYANLRDFYAMVVKKEAESIVLKKN